MGRRVLAFFLGMLFGIIFIVGGVALSVYIVVCKVEVKKMLPATETYMGDLANKSAYDIVMEVYRLYGEKIGVADEEGKYFTLRQFCDTYNINLDTAFGDFKLPDEVLEMPAFEFFAEGGMDRALGQIKLSTIPAVVNMFGDGEGVFSQELTEELSKFSLLDLFSEDVGFAGVMVNVRFAQLVPSAFPAEDSNNKLMWAVGQTSIGKAISGVAGNDNFMMQLKPGGAFETLGSLELSAFTGENSRYVNAILGENATFADIINDEGNLDIDGLLGGLMMGDLLGCKRNKKEDVTDYQELIGGEQAETRVMYAIVDGETLYVKTNDYGENWYEAELDCDKEDNHVHTVGCYDFVWYSAGVCNKEHDHSEAKDLLANEKYYARVQGLYTALVNLSVADVTSGDDTAITNEIKALTLRDVMGEDVPDMLKDIEDTRIGELQTALDNMYIGGLLKYTREETTVDEGAVKTRLAKHEKTAEYLVKLTDDEYAMSEDGKVWYKARLTCDKDHSEHPDRECYSYVWYKNKSQETEVDGMMRKLAEMKVHEMGDLNETVKTFTLYDVLGEDVPDMLKEVQDTQIGNLEDAINALYLGSAMSYVRRPVSIEHYPTQVPVKSVNDEILRVGGVSDDYKTADYAKSVDGKTWYEATFDCFDKTHVNKDDHTSECFPFVWYSHCKKNCALSHEHDNYFDDEELYLPVKGVSKAFVNCKLTNLGDKMNDLTLRQLGIDSDGNNILKSIEDVKIMDIGKEINALDMGVVLGYVKDYTCTVNHEHKSDCPHRWLELCENHTSNSLHTEDDHVEIDGKTYGIVKGLNAKIADKTVANIGDGQGVTDIAKSLTIGDLIDSGMMDVGGTNNEYKFAIIYCGNTNAKPGHPLCDHRDNCNLAGFMAASVLNKNLSATEYWENAHKDMDEAERNEHRYEWKQLTLNEFITMMLSAI